MAPSRINELLRMANIDTKFDALTQDLYVKVDSNGKPVRIVDSCLDYRWEPVILTGNRRYICNNNLLLTAE